MQNNNNNSVATKNYKASKKIGTLYKSRLVACKSFSPIAQSSSSIKASHSSCNGSEAASLSLPPLASPMSLYALVSWYKYVYKVCSQTCADTTVQSSQTWAEYQRFTKII